MHGVKKEKYSEAVALARKQAEQQRVSDYINLQSKIVSLRKENALTDEGLQLSEEMLSINPEYYSLWNYRRLIFLDRLPSRPKEEIQALFEAELKFLVRAIQGHPKSYWAWHHRFWILEHIPTPNWEYEIQLCNKMLDLDIRNFHCWDYRRKALTHIETFRPVDELEYTFKKICQNFSNYSAFHLRTKLLPQVYPPGDPKLVESLEKEFDLVRNAVFTEPADQSPWFYHRWLLGKSQENLEILGAFKIPTHAGTPQIFVVFSEAVKFREGALKVFQSNEFVTLKWFPAHHIENHFSHIWAANLSKESMNDDLVLKADSKDIISRSIGSLMKQDFSVSIRDPFSSITSTYPASTKKKLFNEDILNKELSSISELVELEPGSKWPLLTCALLHHGLGHYPQAIEIIQDLVTLDSNRQNYYRDLKSQLILEQATNGYLLEEIDGQSTILKAETEIDLSKKQITTLHLTERLSAFKKINLSLNELTKMNGIYLLYSAEEILLDNNQIQTLRGLKYLPRLKILSLQNNLVETEQDLEELDGLPLLESLDLRGNPIAKNPSYHSIIRQKISNLKILDGAPFVS